MTTSPPKKTCFIIMPFSSMDGYEHGHFSRVYEYLIRPACIDAGLEPIRGDEVKGTNYIAIDILQKIIKSDLVICDLSGKNANVMYELGIRQAFDLPVVLLKDQRTDRVFDIQGLRTLEYTESLRIDSVENNKKELSEAIKATLNLESHEINSLVRLLGVEKASIKKLTEVSSETSLILISLKDISTRIAAIEDNAPKAWQSDTINRFTSNTKTAGALELRTSQHNKITLGEEVFNISKANNHQLLGILIEIKKNELVIKPKNGKIFSITVDDPIVQYLSDIPF